MKLIFLWRARTGFIKAKTWLPCQIVIELGSEILHENTPLFVFAVLANSAIKSKR